MTPDVVLEIIRQIGEMLEPAALAAWNVYMAQIHVNAIQLMWGAIFSGVVVLAMIVGWCLDNYEGQIVYAFFGVIALVLAVILGTESYGRFANPAYYAIQSLLSIAK